MNLPTEYLALAFGGLLLFFCTTLVRIIIAPRIMRSTRMMWGTLLALAAFNILWTAFFGQMAVRFGSLPFLSFILIGISFMGFRYATAWHLREFFHALLFVLCTTIVANLYLSLMAANHNPFIEEYLVAIDAWFGFDWRDVNAWRSSAPFWWNFLSFVYYSISDQVAFLMLLLVLSGNFLRLRAVLLAGLWTLFAVGIIFTLLPAIKVGVYFYPHGDWPAVSHHVTDHLLSLRDGSLVAFVLTFSDAFVSLPSFHASLALFCAYMAWPLRGFRIPFLVWNGFMILATLPVGEHYLTDVLVSIPMTLLILYAAHRFVASDPVWSDSPDVEFGNGGRQNTYSPSP